MDRNQAFQEYKESTGADLVSEIDEVKTSLKNTKAKLRSVHKEFTGLKEEITKLTDEVLSLKSSVGINDNEYKTKQTNLSDMNISYKEIYTELKELKDLIAQLNLNSDEKMVELLAEFEKWHHQTFDALEKQVEQEEEIHLFTDEDRDAFFNAKSKADKLHKKTATVNKRKN